MIRAISGRAPSVASFRPANWASPSLGCPLHRRSDVLVMTEQVRRVVLVLQRHEPVVICAKCSLDAVRPLFGLEPDMIDVVAAGRKGTHRLRHLPRPADIRGVLPPDPAKPHRSPTRTA